MTFLPDAAILSIIQHQGKTLPPGRLVKNKILLYGKQFLKQPYHLIYIGKISLSDKRSAALDFIICNNLFFSHCSIHAPTFFILSVTLIYS